jgi:hypothetical protein
MHLPDIIKMIDFILIEFIKDSTQKGWDDYKKTAFVKKKPLKGETIFN